MKARTSSFTYARGRLGFLCSIPRFCFRSALVDGFHPAAATGAMVASLRERYRPEEAYRLGLLRPGASARAFPQFISKSKFARAQKRVNPSSWESILSDKAMFYRFCTHASLPVPELFAIYFQHARGLQRNGRALITRHDWLRFLRYECPEEFVVKPARGSYGLGVKVLHREGELLRDVGGSKLTIEQLYDSLRKDPAFDSFVFQERCRNHPVVSSLSGADGLQTLRMMTNVAADGTPELMYAFLKVIVGNCATDNYQSGKSGTLLARVSLQDGTIESCWRYKSDGGIVGVQKHPITGVAFKGYRLPGWSESVALVKTASMRFLPIRTVGWDVAVTPHGAILIEGNIWWDPPTHSFEMDRMVKRILGD